MTPIKNIGEPVSPDRLKEQDRIRQSRSERVGSSGRTSESDAASTVSRADSVDISPSAKKLAETANDVTRFQDVLRSMRNEGSEQILELRQRIETGEFDKPEVLERVSEAILRLPNFVRFEEKSEPVAARSDKELALIRDRVQSNRYQSEQVWQQVANAIIRDIGAF